MSDGTIFKTVRRETAEETRGTVHISHAEIAGARHISLPAGRHKFTAFVVDKAVSCTAYYAVDPSLMSKEYRETDGMTRFPLKQIRDHFHHTGKIRLLTQNNKLAVPTGRCKEALKTALRAGLL
jgi:hypothetical protein